MNMRVRLVWALLLAAVAGLGSFSYMKQLRQEVTVVVAARAIPPRTIISVDMLETRRIHAGTKAAVLPTAIDDPEKVVGLLAVQEIPRGEVLRDDPRWITSEAGALQAAKQDRVSHFLPRDARAITIVVDSAGLVGGRVKEGDLVDILFTSSSDSTGGVYTAMLLQHVLVLGVDDGSEVTLLVSPEQAVDLTLAKRLGKLDLALGPPTPDTVNVPPSSPLKFLEMGRSE